MNELINKIKSISENILNRKIIKIEQIQNPTVNTLFKLSTEKDAYIFKLYKQKDWPENGKLKFVNKKLIESNINCAKLIMFDRDNPDFPKGYSIEEFIEGQNAKEIEFNRDEGKAFYKKLAEYISRLHRIKMSGFGYIGSGIPDYEALDEFFTDDMEDRFGWFYKENILDEKLLNEIKSVFLNAVKVNPFPPVLCHGDISTKNIIISPGKYSEKYPEKELILLDWDDAMAYNWVADLSRMTYWMRFYYNEYEYRLYREAFLENYKSEHDAAVFDSLEKSYHLYFGLDYMSFEKSGVMFERYREYLMKIVNQ